MRLVDKRKGVFSIYSNDLTKILEFTEYTGNNVTELTRITAKGKFLKTEFIDVTEVTKSRVKGRVYKNIRTMLEKILA